MIQFCYCIKKKCEWREHMYMKEVCGRIIFAVSCPPADGGQAALLPVNLSALLWSCSSVSAAPAVSRINCTYLIITSTVLLLPRVNVTPSPAPSSLWWMFMLYATRGSLSITHSLSLSLARSLSLSHYCFAPAEAARVREGGSRSLPSTEGKTWSEAFCQVSVSISAAFTHRRRCVLWVLSASVPVEPGCKVQQLLFLGAQRLITAFIWWVGGMRRLRVGGVAVGKCRGRQPALESGRHSVMLVQKLL